MSTANLLAVATMAFLNPFREANLTAQDLRREKRFILPITHPAASMSILRIAASPHLDMRPE